MALTAAQIASLLFKQSLGKSSTNTSREFFEEPRDGRPIVFPEQVWQEAADIPSTAPTLAHEGESGVVKYFEDLSLTAVAGVPNSFFAAELVNAIPFNFGDGSYNYTLKSNTDASIAFGQGDWIVDPNTGTLTFYGTVPANMPPKISFYKYIGPVGVGSGSGDADQITFDPSGTGLIATDVQAAIAEVKAFADAVDSDVQALVLDDLGDVDTTFVPPVDGDTLVYDEIAQIFKPSQPVGGGGGGENYLSTINSTFETSGGAPDVGDWESSDTDKITITSSLTSPLAGVASGIITKLAVNAVNSYVSVESKTIDDDRRGKPIIIKMSADFTHANYVSDNLEFQLWDITGTPTQIYVSGDVKIKKAKGDIILVGYPESTCSQVELRAVIATDSATSSSWTGKIDRVQLGPDKLVPSLFFRTEEIDLASSGDFTGGSIRVSRVGSQVTVSILTSLTYSASTESRVSAAGLIPSWARPTANVPNITITSPTAVTRFDANADGSILTRVRDWSGGSLSTSSVGSGSISYTVPDTESPLISTTEALFKTTDIRVTRATAIAISGATTIVDYSSVLGNGSELFNLTTGAFRPKESGLYAVTAKCNTINTAWTALSQIATLSFAGNEVARHRSIGGAATYQLDLSGSIKVNLVANTDYFFSGNCSIATSFEGISFSITKIPDLSVYGIGAIDKLGHIGDVDLSTPPNNAEALLYDNATSTWKAGNISTTIASGSITESMLATGANGNRQTYTSGSGTFTVPANVNRLVVMGCGGGGGGGGGVNRTANFPSANGGAGAGGQSGYASIETMTVNPGDSIAYAVGAGGAGGAPGNGANASNGANGGNTTFGSILIWRGGRGGQGGLLNGGTLSLGGGQPGNQHSSSTSGLTHMGGAPGGNNTGTNAAGVVGPSGERTPFRSGGVGGTSNSSGSGSSGGGGAAVYSNGIAGADSGFDYNAPAPTNAGAGTGAGGGGAGSINGTSIHKAKAGGNGGSGFLRIFW